MFNFTFSLNKKVSVIFIFTFTIISIVDSTIVKFVTYSGNEIPTTSYVALFILFCIIFGISTIILITSVKKNSSNPIYKQSISVRYFYSIAFSTQLLTIGIIAITILQMILLNKYNLMLLIVSTYLTHITALFFLLFLIYIFVGWLRSKRNYTIAFYMISFMLISVGVAVSATYLEYFYYRSFSMDRKPFPLSSFVIRQEVTPFSESLRTVFDIVYLASFIAIWIATMTLLYEYRHKVGRIRYIILMSLPLIYYSFTYQSYFGNVFSHIVLESPVAFGVSYVLTFSATKQVGALLFSLTFLTAATVVTKKEIQTSLLISAIGIALLYGSIEIATLQYRLYPPFGLVTQAIMPLGSYLILTGIFISSTNVAKDAELRGQISRSAKSQLNLLRTIGTSQMEKELVKKFRAAEKHTHEVEATEQSFSEEDVKRMVREVLNELYPKARDKTDKTETT
jgi:hypothetical protein